MLIPDPEPIYAWQVLDSRDGRWGTISIYLNTPAREITGDGAGHNLVLQTRSHEIAMGQMKQFAEMHTQFGQPVRLYRFIPDPDFKPECP